MAKEKIMHVIKFSPRVFIAVNPITTTVIEVSPKGYIFSNYTTSKLTEWFIFVFVLLNKVVGNFKVFEVEGETMIVRYKALSGTISKVLLSSKVLRIVHETRQGNREFSFDIVS